MKNINKWRKSKLTGYCFHIWIFLDSLGNFLQIPGFLFRCTGNIENAELAESKSKLCLRFKKTWIKFSDKYKKFFRFIWRTKERFPWVLWILWNQSSLFWRLISALFWIYHHKYFFYSWFTYEIWFSNFTPEHFLFIHRGKESSTGISKNIENLFLEKPWSALTPFTYRQNLVHEIIVSNASPDLQLRP